MVTHFELRKSVDLITEMAEDLARIEGRGNWKLIGELRVQTRYVAQLGQSGGTIV